jgi:hypothetical protein
MSSSSPRPILNHILRHNILTNTTNNSNIKHKLPTNNNPSPTTNNNLNIKPNMFNLPM